RISHAKAQSRKGRTKKNSREGKKGNYPSSPLYYLTILLFSSWRLCAFLHFARFPHPSGCETSGKSKTQGDNGLFRAADEWSGNQNNADFRGKTATPGLRKSRNVQAFA